MSQHTPGPWRVETNDREQFVIWGQGSVVAMIDMGTPPDRPNAFLIAAAPDLLEVLSNLVGAVRLAAHGEYSPREDEWLDRAEELIQKFTGTGE